MQRTLNQGKPTLKRQLLEKIAQYPKPEIALFIDKLLRFVDFGADDVYLLEELIQKIEEHIENIEIFGEDSDAPHSSIKAQVKSPRNAVHSRHYLYIRRHPAGEKRQERSCGPIPFKPELLYSIQSKSTGEVRTARCSQVFVPQGVTWEQLLQKPTCRVALDFLDANLQYVASEVFDFPDCMEEEFAPHRSILKEIQPDPSSNPSERSRKGCGAISTGISEMPQAIARSQTFDLSHSSSLVHSSIRVHRQSEESVARILTELLELSQILPDFNWSLKQLKNQSVVLDGNQKEILAYGNHQLSLMMAPAAFLNLLEKIAVAVSESDSAPRGWREKARNLNIRILAAARCKGSEAFFALFGLKNS